MEQIDLEKLEKALIYVDRIAEGRNPVYNLPADNDSVLNDPNVIRCMFFIKEVLTAVKNNGGKINKIPKGKKSSFPLEKLNSYIYETDKTITQFVEQLNMNIDNNIYKKITYTQITTWLKANGFLMENDDTELNRKVTLATEKGQEIGISHLLQTSLRGECYYRIVYNQQAQEYIVKCLPQILGEKQVKETVEKNFNEVLKNNNWVDSKES